MNHIGLFEGIGGFSLAARWMNWNTIAYCEINQFCQKVLKYHFPNANPHEDIKTTDFTIYRGKCDIVTGGFPCQPYSHAGQRKGKEDDRHLWPSMLRSIRDIRPRWVVGENVPGLVDWKGGMVLKEIKDDLENEGFEMFPPVIIPACAKNADHRRDRLWIIAHSHSSRLQENVQGLGETLRLYPKSSGEPNRLFNKQWAIQQRNHGELRGGHGVSYGLDTTTFSEGRIITEGIKAFGNSIVPQVALEIFKAIQSFENLNTN